LLLVSVFISTLMAGCGDDGFSDLRQYITDVKAKPKGTIEPLPEMKTVEPFVFKPEGLRDPFKAITISEEENDPQVGVGNGIRPDTTRRKEELEAFPLDSLRMVGTIIMKANLWALVKASDNTIYRVQVGTPGTWREQQTSLALTE
jgi:type IV pilus assembly protein PilP